MKIRIPFQLAAAGSILCLLSLHPGSLSAQSEPSQNAQTSQPQPQDSSPQPQNPAGKVLFSRSAGASAQQEADQPPSAAPDTLAVAPAERSALTFTAYNLDLHLTPPTSGVSAHAILTIRNDGPKPLSRLILDISSSLHWDAFSLPGKPLKFETHLLDTDLDHTGRMQESAVILPAPLAPGESVTLTALYSGAIPASAERLQRIGAPPARALASDWDSVTPDGIALRGFGNVLWYPISASPLFLGDGAKVVEAVGAAKLRESDATVRLRLSIEYTGDPPEAAFFCGRREPLNAISDNPDIPASQGRGVAIATFDPRPIGFRTLDLFVTSQPATLVGTTSNPALISALTTHSEALDSYKAAAQQVEPLLQDWFGPRPESALTILDHPGEPYEDQALVLRPIQAVDAGTLAPELAHSLTHAWIHSSHPWIEEGLARFAEILWLESTHGREAALNQLQDDARPLALAEPELPADAAKGPTNAVAPPLAPGTSSSSTESNPPSADTPAPSISPEGKNLLNASGELFYRTKAAAVWWMLRGIVGDGALKQTLRTYRSEAHLDRDPHGFERALEETSHKDLAWFFRDWIYQDMGLPDLSIVNVTPSQLDSRAGLPSGWLVAVDVRNDGYAEAEVPVTVRSALSSQTERLRIPGRSSASIRIVFPGKPESVQVNDGSVPETRTSVHVNHLVTPAP